MQLWSAEPPLNFSKSTELVENGRLQHTPGTRFPPPPPPALEPCDVE
jgi:hypothetical protein